MLDLYASDDISDGLLAHLHARNTTLAVVSRAPLAKLERYKHKRGWDFPWYSSYGTDFNFAVGSSKRLITSSCWPVEPL